MANNGFIFEIIVPSITTKKECMDPRKLSVDVNFHRIALSATCSRLNVSEFPPDRGFEFYAALEEIKYMVTSMPVLFVVKYDEEVLGISETVWPQTSLTHIHSAMVEICHVGQCDISLDDKIVGCMEFVMRICKKCETLEPSLSALELNSNLRDLVKRDDILLMMANDPSYRCPANHQEQRADGVEQFEGEEKSFRGAPCPDPRVCAIAKLVEMLNQVGKPKDDCSREPIECHDCEPGRFDTSSSDISSSDDDQGTRHQDDRNVPYEKEQMCWLCPNEIPPPPPLTQTSFKTQRQCVVCNQNMAYLPKFSACPKCGYKPMPQPKEKAYDENLTAHDIIEEYAEQSPCSDSDEKTDVCGKRRKPTNIKNKLRCKCNGTNSCAFCRVQKLAEDMMLAAKGLTTNPNDMKCGDCEVSSKNEYNTCKDDSPSCRPFLARVFSELRLLYDVQPPRPAKKKKISEFCEKQIQSIFSKPKTQESHGLKPPTPVPEDISNQVEKPKPKDKIQVKKQLPEDKSNQVEKEKPKSLKIRLVKNPQHRIPASGPHKKCFRGIKLGRNVPRNMGFLWTKDPRPKWRPGAINKRIRRIMHYFLDIHPTSTPEARRIVNQYCQKICEERKVIPPTLHVRKKQDAYFVTLQGHTNPANLQDCMQPCDKQNNPVTFKISKHPKLILFRHLKRQFKNMGFEKCVCHKPISKCICRSFLDKKHLEFAVKKECSRRQIPCVTNDLVLSTTSISEADMEFDVSPPATVVKPNKVKLPKMVNNCTQYVKADTIWNTANGNDKNLRKFLATYDCTVGEKYGKPRFRALPGQVIPGMEWKKAMLDKKRAKRAALLAKKKFKMGAGKTGPPKVEAAAIPFGPKGPPRTARDGTALDANGKPLLDADGNAFVVKLGSDGKVQVTKEKMKSLDMIKYLTEKGLLLKNENGRKNEPMPPGSLNPEYLAMERAQRRKKYLELFERTPLPVCMVDRLGKPCANYNFEC